MKKQELFCFFDVCLFAAWNQSKRKINKRKKVWLVFKMFQLKWGLGLNIYESFFLFKRGIIKHYCMLLYAMHGIKAIILLSFLRSSKLFGDPRYKAPCRIFMAAPITVLREKSGRSCGRDLEEFECQKEETQNSAEKDFVFLLLCNL